MEYFEFKKRLFFYCEQLITERISMAKKMLDEAQSSANTEEKSSAGDKYETARAMGHLNRDMNAKQMAEAIDQLKILQSISLVRSKTAQSGSLIVTSKELFFIAISLGEILFENQKVIIVSPLTPVAQLLIGQKVGQTFLFKNTKVEVLEIH